MKKAYLIITMLLATTFAQAQIQWKVVYQYKRVETEESKKRMDSILKKRPEFASMMKRFRQRNANKVFNLDFTKQASLFTKKEELDKPSAKSRINFSFPEPIIFQNINEKKFLKQVNSFNKTYLITDSLPNYHWKITKESKQIGNYLVIKAVGTAKSRNRKGEMVDNEVIAWFTPQIPVSIGPKLYGGLPGLILELRQDRDLFVAKEILVNSKNKTEIKAPEKGTKMTQKAYDELMKERIEKMREMRKNYRKRRKNRHR